jgi:hypothetical protein
MAQPTNRTADAVTPCYPGCRLAFLADLDVEPPKHLVVTMYLMLEDAAEERREGEPPDFRSRWITLNSTRRCGSRTVEVSGVVPHVVAGTYRVARIDVAHLEEQRSITVPDGCPRVRVGSAGAPMLPSALNLRSTVKVMRGDKNLL